jgi:hypothetical protein
MEILATRTLTRFHAAAIHLAVSIVVIALVASAMIGIWYPAPFFANSGGLRLILLIGIVDATLGPLLTLIVFDTGKRLLWLDLSVIAFFQIAALVYGVSVMFGARPVYIVFVKDRFELVRTVDLDTAREKSKLSERNAALPIGGPLFISAIQPTDPDERRKVLFESLDGVDIHLMPKYYQSYEAAKAEAARRSQPLQSLSRFNSVEELMGAGINVGNSELEQAGFLPLKGISKDLAVIVDKRTGEILKVVNLRPW